MADKTGLPQAYTTVLSNRFTSEQVDAFISSSGKPIFVYGSLMFPSIIGNVTQTRENVIANAMTRAVLLGHQRYAVIGADFPAIMASEDSTHSVEGILVFGLNNEQHARLDVFESGLYTKETVRLEVALKEGGTRIIDGHVYIWGGDRDELHEVEESLWTVDSFIQSSSYASWG
ncbi:MAG: hypothetical protein M1836_003915 [Candelina mexicana]|nr:MAG: hypothetical protein M1836_003915 [Candelina mexicana]